MGTLSNRQLFQEKQSADSLLEIDRMHPNALRVLSVWMKLMNVLVMSPVTVDPKRNEIKIKKGYVYFMYCLIVGSVHFFTFYKSISAYILTIGFDTFVEVLYTFSGCLVIWSFLVRTITGYNDNKNKLVDVLKNIVWINDQLRRVDPPKNHVGLDRTIKIELICLLLVWLYRSCLAYLYFHRINIFCIWDQQFFYVCQIFFFYNYVLMINDCFRSINRSLGSIRKQLGRTSIVYESRIVRNIVVIKKCYEKSIDCSVFINRMFQWQNLNYMVNVFIETSVLCFLCIKKILNYYIRVDTSLLFRALVLLWPVILIVFFTTIVRICSRTYEEAKRIGRAVSDIERLCKSHRLKNQLQIVSMQVLHQPELFHVNGLFKLNMNLLYQIFSSMVAYVITYLSIELSK